MALTKRLRAEWAARVRAHWPGPSRQSVPVPVECVWRSRRGQAPGHGLGGIEQVRPDSPRGPRRTVLAAGWSRLAGSTDPPHSSTERPAPGAVVTRWAGEAIG